MVFRTFLQPLALAASVLSMPLAVAAHEGDPKRLLATETLRFRLLRDSDKLRLWKLT